MGCIYNTFEGKCQLFEEGELNNPEGCDKQGVCEVGYDPVPADNCQSYESDWMCYDCGADFNADEECSCNE